MRQPIISAFLAGQVERAIKAGELQSFKFRDARRFEIEDLEKAKKREQNDVFRVHNRP
jgi:hypothetical protein